MGVYRSEDIFQELVLRFTVGPGDGAEVARLCGKHLYQPSHLAGPTSVFDGVIKGGWLSSWPEGLVCLHSPSLG